jgi:hypothetical protein
LTREILVVRQRVTRWSFVGHCYEIAGVSQFRGAPKWRDLADGGT